MAKRTQTVRGIYLLPNLLTTTALFFAFYAIISAVSGDFNAAASAIFVSMIMDSLDGRVARLTNTESDFGVEYDSLADMVSFGVAPAMVMFLFALNSLPRFGWLISFIYMATVALRLARFNTQIGVVNKNYFQGLPCPPAAAVVASLIWVAESYDLQSQGFTILLALVAMCLGALMVSNVRYNSFKEMDLRGRVPFALVVLVMLVLVLIALKPPIVLLTAFGIYGLSGPVLTLMRIRAKRQVRNKIRRARFEDSKTN